MKLSNILKFKVNREILTKSCCENSILRATDIETVITFGPIDLEDGVYDTETLDALPKRTANEILDFPLLPQDTYSNRIVLTKEQLKDLIAHSSKDETRIFLNGIHVGHKQIVSTDGHRLRILESQEEADAILPRKPLEKLEKIMKKGQKVDILIGVTWFKTEKLNGFEVYGRLIKREYPRVRGIFQKVGKGWNFNVSKIDFNKIKPLLDKTLRVNFKNENGRVILSVPQTDYKQDVGMCNNADKIDFDVNLKYFVEGWAEGCEYEFYNELSPIQQTKDGKIFGVVMPLRK